TEIHLVDIALPDMALQFRKSRKIIGPAHSVLQVSLKIKRFPLDFGCLDLGYNGPGVCPLDFGIVFTDEQRVFRYEEKGIRKPRTVRVLRLKILSLILQIVP